MQVISFDWMEFDFLMDVNVKTMDSKFRYLQRKFLNRCVNVFTNFNIALRYDIFTNR